MYDIKYKNTQDSKDFDNDNQRDIYEIWNEFPYSLIQSNNYP